MRRALLASILALALALAFAFAFAAPLRAGPPDPPRDGADDAPVAPAPGDESRAEADRRAAEERRVLDETARFVAAGGDVGAALRGHDSLLGHPAMSVTRLHEAAAQGYATVARYLVEHGADPRAKAPTKSDLGDLTPADVARRTGHADLAEAIERYHVRRFWFSPGDESVVELALDSDVVVDSWFDASKPKPATDLLIRPDLPEIRAAAGSVVAAAPGASYAELSAVPASAKWAQALAPEATAQGCVFLARSRSGRLFKALVARMDRDAGHLTLSFTDLNRVSGEVRAVRDVVAEFQSALADGRAAAAANLCTTEYGRTVRDAPAGSPAARPERRRVRRAEVAGDKATVVLYERRRVAAGAAADLGRLVTFELVRVGPSWRIQGMSSKPADEKARDASQDGEPADDEI